MADRQADILRSLNAQNATQADVYAAILEIRDMLNDGSKFSQSRVYDSMPGRKVAEPSSDKWKPIRRDTNNSNDDFRGVREEFTAGFRKAMQESLIGSEFKNSIKRTLNDFAQELGMQVSDIPSFVGKNLSQQMTAAMKNTKFGEKLFSGLDGAANQIASSLSQAAGDIAAAGGDMSAGIPAFKAGIAGAAKSLSSILPQIAAIGAALYIADQALEAFSPLVEGLVGLFGAVSKAANRATETAKKNLEYAKDRLTKDLNAIAEEPFKILKESAQEVQEAWSSTMGTITATQGYTKADLQDLMSVYAQRLRDEGLTRYVSGADITENLAKVLESGLSGKVAEEFAYIATKLSAAVPTQDFFSYANTYASIAANAISAGASEAQAISYANDQLESFASNVLYASRQIAGGFSTGLSNASTLLEDATKIAVASKSGNVSSISGVLTSVSAIVGAVAPDLASSMVDAVVSAAIGGNSSSYTALRALSGAGAANTAFLNALAQDPQKVFTSLFQNLAELQGMSSDNFMEVAEGLSEVFGVSMDAFARVDFNYLAKAISEMNVNNSSLSENMALLVSGQTTSTAEQLKAEQINQYMLEEGLAYVLDNEVARSIQEHMWDEQLAREIEQTTFGVELQGATMSLLQGLAQTVESILNFLNPFYWLKKIGNLITTSQEAAAQDKDLKAILEAGKVGSGNALALRRLTSRNKDLNLTTNYLELLGESSAVSKARYNQQVWNSLSGQSAAFGGASSLFGGLIDNVVDAAASAYAGASASPRSGYKWGMVGKSATRYLANTSTAQESPYELLSASQQVANKSNAKFQSFLDTMDKYVEKNKTYDEWVSTATKYGIVDVAAALEEQGYTEAELKGRFESKEAQRASEYQHEREVNEDLFWATGTNFWAVEHPEFQGQLLDLTEEQLNQLIVANKQLTEFYNQWVDYYVKHTAYSRETLNAYDVAAIRNAEKSESGDAILALANALTSNMVDLKDPAVQQNALLSKILLVCEAIMQQNNSTSQISLPTALSALGMGLTS